MGPRACRTLADSPCGFLERTGDRRRCRPSSGRIWGILPRFLCISDGSGGDSSRSVHGQAPHPCAMRCALVLGASVLERSIPHPSGEHWRRRGDPCAARARGVFICNWTPSKSVGHETNDRVMVHGDGTRADGRRSEPDARLSKIVGSGVGRAARSIVGSRAM